MSIDTLMEMHEYVLENKMLASRGKINKFFTFWPIRSLMSTMQETFPKLLSMNEDIQLPIC